MASDFRILLHRTSQSLHLKLVGDFDAAAAIELITSINKCRFGVNKIFVHTSCLNSINPLGVETFRTNLKVDIPSFINLVFTGEKAAMIAPEGFAQMDLQSRSADEQQNRREQLDLREDLLVGISPK
jgi:hypothetical protein